ncbi:uncharacterized protein PSFLO_06036 [Pseudozyma flocculosa]|uniref:Uncharacterized protein n=1 Tax=Pseudozyma flocculosa TaxID=84751 RepID=A0A5C3F7S1_9BASI|nr:uncharacterized protein PSFLO_06036 [Pseudozyma flocculosa]
MNASHHVHPRGAASKRSACPSDAFSHQSSVGLGRSTIGLLPAPEEWQLSTARPASIPVLPVPASRCTPGPTVRLRGRASASRGIDVSGGHRLAPIRMREAQPNKGGGEHRVLRGEAKEDEVADRPCCIAPRVDQGRRVDAPRTLSGSGLRPIRCR